MDRRTAAAPDSGIGFSAEKQQALSHEETWGNLKCLLLSERIYSEKAAYCMIPTIWDSRKRGTTETAGRSVAARGQEGGREAEHRGSSGQGNYSE